QSEVHIINAVFLCSDEPHSLLAALAPALNEKASLPVEKKLAELNLSAGNIFPFSIETGNIDSEAFNSSFLRQPSLFLRLRPGKESQVLDKLAKATIDFTDKGNGCIALPNATKLEDVITLNKEAVVQDRNSQKVFDFLPGEWFNEKISVWDCCAASGGKAILLFDKLPAKMKLTVSDIRPNILHNCKMRLREAGININHAFVADVSKKIGEELDDHFDMIVCDAPCTGSGTWSRTPEQLAYFKTAQVEAFTSLQKSIATNALTYLKKDGIFFYITCSVFKKENEEVVDHLLKNAPVVLLHAGYLPGYNEQADTMFVAVLKMKSGVATSN
ncbi:MAG: methyltransferase domain-containing protein, partial [Chitinophagaceae bacterium]